ncbi:MAG: NADH-quinone oxidoreductase subunit NuoE family protein [Planctomycetota bacterium]|jgi:NADH-quinone oxidoreductase subunit E
MAAFSPELVARVEELWQRYPEKKAALLPAMHLIQAARGGWFSDETIRDTAALFDVPDMHVRGMVGFYDMFHREPVGRHIVRLCKTLACKLRGADELRAHIAEKYGVRNGETTADEAFTFKCFECLGHCSTAPMMLVDEEKYENLTVGRLDEILGGLR